MATPHIAGAVALLWSAHPELKNNPDATQPVLNSTAVPILSNTCDSGSPKTPNNTFGNGRVDILAAVDSATLFLNSAASVKTQGSATFPVSLPLTGEPGVECRNSGNLHTLVFTFSDNVVSGMAALTLGIGQIQGSPVFSGNTMTVHLARVGDVQKLTVTLTNVMSSGGQLLGGAAVSMNVLVGDVDANKTVERTDVTLIRDQVGMPIGVSNFREDVRVDGTINTNDVKSVRNALGHNLP
jgi:hypothetical protein